mmetsp:Transcript_37862/g.95168  ORF Transcript_37862/g.95168 Transcript_37862/m.95168 type:complete len:235 (+) Transcript_37862:955-1659(+)
MRIVVILVGVVTLGWVRVVNSSGWIPHLRWPPLHPICPDLRTVRLLPILHLRLVASPHIVATESVVLPPVQLSIPSPNLLSLLSPPPPPPSPPPPPPPQTQQQKPKQKMAIALLSLPSLTDRTNNTASLPHCPSTPSHPSVARATVTRTTHPAAATTTLLATVLMVKWSRVRPLAPSRLDPDPEATRTLRANSPKATVLEVIATASATPIVSPVSAWTNPTRPRRRCLHPPPPK